MVSSFAGGRGRGSGTLEGTVLTPLFPTEVPDGKKGHLAPQNSTTIHKVPRGEVMLASDADLG